jgi:hypothetical protein
MMCCLTISEDIFMTKTNNLGFVEAYPYTGWFVDADKLDMIDCLYWQLAHEQVEYPAVEFEFVRIRRGGFIIRILRGTKMYYLMPGRVYRSLDDAANGLIDLLYEMHKVNTYEPSMPQDENLREACGQTMELRVRDKASQRKRTSQKIRRCS